MDLIIITNESIVVCKTHRIAIESTNVFQILGGRRYEEDSRRPSGGGDDDYHRRERDRYNNNPSRRDQGSGKYNHHDRGK
jgi:hypothetical protein